MPYERLALEPAALRPEYDVVVVGSGYGASILAARLAEGRRLAVFERGGEWPPGSFPEHAPQLTDILRNERNPLGLVDLHRHKELDVLVGCGLGGTSLINANVLIEPDADLFDQPQWPEAIRRARDDGRLADFFRTVRGMLDGGPCDERAAPDGLRKVEAFKEGLERVGGAFSLARLAVTFREGRTRVPQLPCTLCGDCVTGCNVSAKNTLAFNYLPLAKRRGAEIFTHVEVRYIDKRGPADYVIHAVRHETEPRRRTPLSVRARSVVLGAGSLGSTEILLRSKLRGLVLSEALGRHVSGNADLLGIAYNSDVRTDDVGFGTRAPHYADVGPTIVGIGDFRRDGRIPLGERFLIEEGVIPTALAGLMRRVAPLIRNTDDFRPSSPAQAARRIERAARDAGLRFHPKGALNHTLVFLGMGHDSSAGMLMLDERENLQLHWAGAHREPIFATMEATMQRMSKAIGGIYMQNPRSRWWMGRGLMTVHPLGGCRMGVDPTTGVVDDRGRVFDPSGADGAVHDGLYVVDGALLPTSVGVNPMLTISALAERIAAHAVDLSRAHARRGRRPAVTRRVERV